MHLQKQSRKVWSGALLGLSTVALVGSAHAAINVYSTETFSGGTPKYSIDGGNASSWTTLGSAPATTGDGTGYIFGGSKTGVVANGEPTDITPGGTIPSGQHAVISSSSNRNITSNYAMPLVTDGATALNVTFDFMSYSLGGFAALGGSYIAYSSDGSFSTDGSAGDEVILASFGVGQNNGEVVRPTVQLAEETWGSLDLSFTEAGSGITFSDLAQIKIRRIALTAAGLEADGKDSTRDVLDTNTNHITFLDNITVSANTIPEPSSAALLGLTGCALLLRRRK